MIEPVRVTEDAVLLLDQRRLPHDEQWVSCRDASQVAEAIQTMVVRGAPAIGVAAAGGMALAARGAAGSNVEQFREALDAAGSALVASRPTAVNLAWGVRRVRAAIEGALEAGAAPPVAAERALAEAQAIRDEDVAANRALGRHGSLFVPDGARILTHCNAGALATAGYGTALGVVRAAVEEGKKVTVYADETRPFLQGARLTAWELQQDGIPVVLITDNMAGALMARGEIDLVIVGADRIAINGDFANKIGTYTVAVLARRHGVPFYVAAPVSSLDADCPGGEAIPIEERSPDEVTHIGGVRVAAEGVVVRNPAFDVTPADLVTAIVTERGVHRPPFGRSLRAALGLVEESPEPPPSVAVGVNVPAPAEDAANPDEDLF